MFEKIKNFFYEDKNLPIVENLDPPVLRSVLDVIIRKTINEDSLTKNLQSLQRSGDIGSKLEALSDAHSAVSDSVFKTVRAGNVGYYIKVFTPSGKNVDSPLILRKINKILTSPSSYKFVDNFDNFLNQMLRYSKIRGGVACFGVLNSEGSPDHMRAIDPNDVIWGVRNKKYIPHIKSDLFDPLNQFDFSFDYLSLLVENFSYRRLDGKAKTVLPTSPILPVLSTVFMQQRFVDNMMKVLERQAWPRTVITVIEEKLRALIPQECINDPEKLNSWVKEKFSEIEQTFANLSASDAAIISDWMKLDIVGTKDAGNKTLDPKPVLEVFDRYGAQSVKTFGPIIGGKDSLDPLQAFLEGQSIKGFQMPVESSVTDILNFFLKVLGINYYVKFKFNDFEMKPESELENFRSIRYNRTLKLLAAGYISPDYFNILNGATEPIVKDSVLHEIYNNKEWFLKLNSLRDDYSETDTSKSPEKSKNKDKRSDPEASLKKGKIPKKSKTGDTKETKGKNRKIRKPETP